VFGLFGASVVGISTVIVCNLGRDLLLTWIVVGSKDVVLEIRFIAGLQIFDALARNLVLPSLLVHLWFPLFALAVVLTQIVARVCRAAGWAPYCLEHGRHRPFHATGCAATAIVFVGAATTAWIWP
jgi:ABC-type antimicrobial peptide transport system permease subunit